MESTRIAEPRWVLVAQADDLEPGKIKRAEIDALHTVAVLNLDGEFYAYDSRCPHAHFPLWAGRLVGHRLVCAGHSWQFDARTGAALIPVDAPPAQRFPVRVEAGAVYVGWEPPPVAS